MKYTSLKVYKALKEKNQWTPCGKGYSMSFSQGKSSIILGFLESSLETKCPIAVGSAILKKGN